MNETDKQKLLIIIIFVTKIIKKIIISDIFLCILLDSIVFIQYLLKYYNKMKRTCDKHALVGEILKYRSVIHFRYNCKFREKIRQQARRGQIKTDVSQQALGKPLVSKIHCLTSERKPPVPVHNIQTKKLTESKNFCR